jgi:hypothetical protein
MIPSQTFDLSSNAKTETDPDTHESGGIQPAMDQTISSRPYENNGSSENHVASGASLEASLVKRDPDDISGPLASNQDAPPINELVDGLALWDAETGDSPLEGLSLVKINQNERLVHLFTTTMVRVNVHFTEIEDHRGYLRCNGPGCVLCRIGRKLDTRDLLPVYDLLDRTVSVLPISTSQRPYALRPLLSPVLRRVAGGDGRVLIALKSENYYKFSVAVLRLPENADDGTGAIRLFCDRLEDGLIDLASAYQQMENADLAAVRWVKDHMVAKGITL